MSTQDKEEDKQLQPESLEKDIEQIEGMLSKLFKHLGTWWPKFRALFLKVFKRFRK